MCEENHTAHPRSSTMSIDRIQKPEDGFKIREEYRSLQEELQQKADEAGEAGLSVKEIKHYLLKSNNVFRKVKNSREACLDSQLLKTCGVLVKKNIESAQTGLSVFRPSEFAQKLVNFMALDTVDEAADLNQDAWTHFGRCVAPLYNRSVGIKANSVYAYLDNQKPPTKYKRQKQLDKEIVEEKQPEKITNVQSEDETNYNKYERIRDLLWRSYQNNNNNPLNYFKFVINPKSYTYTVENMFHLSLLVRDQLVTIEPDADGIPVLVPIELLTDALPLDGNSAKQCIITITMKEWREAIKVFKIKHPMIPDPLSSASL